MLVLIIASGPDKGRTYEIHDDQDVVLGRDGEPVRLSDRKASRRHAQLICARGRWYIQDLGSRHGTFCNHERIEARTALNDGDYVQIGRTVFVLARMAGGHATPPGLGDSSVSTDQDSAMGVASSSGFSKMVAAGVLVAAVVVVAVNLYQLTITQKFGNQLAAVQTQTERASHQMLASMESFQPGADAPLLQQILTSVEDQGRKQPLVEEMRLAMRMEMHQALAAQQRNAVATHTTHDLLGQVFEKLDGKPTTAQLTATVDDAISSRVNDAVAQLSEASTEASARTRDTILARLDAQDESIRQLGRLEAMIARQPSRLEALLDQKFAGAADEKLDMNQFISAMGGLQIRLSDELGTRLDQVLAHLDAQPSAEQLAATVRAALEAQPDNISPILAQLQERLANHPTSAQLAVMLRSVIENQPDNTTPILAQLAAKLERQPSFDEFARTVQEAIATQSQHLGPQIEALVRKVDRQPSATQLAAMLRSVIEAQPDTVGPVLAQLASTLDNQPTAGQLTQARLEPPQLDSPVVIDMRGGHADASMPLPDSESTSMPRAGRRDRTEHLSPTQEAYRLAFATGAPLTIGAGVLNPITGELSQGRVLDPAAAKAAGITRWQDWYLMDDFAQRMRLQKQAANHLADHARSTDVIRLPQE